MVLIDNDGFRIPLVEEEDGLWQNPSGLLYRIWNNTATRLYDGLTAADIFTVER